MQNRKNKKSKRIHIWSLLCGGLSGQFLFKISYNHALKSPMAYTHPSYTHLFNINLPVCMGVFFKGIKLLLSNKKCVKQVKKRSRILAEFRCIFTENPLFSSVERSLIYNIFTEELSGLLSILQPLLWLKERDLALLCPTLLSLKITSFKSLAGTYY